MVAVPNCIHDGFFHRHVNAKDVLVGPTGFFQLVENHVYNFRAVIRFTWNAIVINPIGSISHCVRHNPLVSSSRWLIHHYFAMFQQIKSSISKYDKSCCFAMVLGQHPIKISLSTLTNLWTIQSLRIVCRWFETSNQDSCNWTSRELRGEGC